MACSLHQSPGSLQAWQVQLHQERQRWGVHLPWQLPLRPLQLPLQLRRWSTYGRKATASGLWHLDCLLVQQQP